MANKNDMLPDISGVFKIDESKIPKTLIEKPAEPVRKNTQAQSVLIPSEDKKTEALRQERMKRTQAVKRKKAVKKKEQLRMLALFGGGALILILIAGLIWGGVARSKRPVVRLAQVTQQDIESYCVMNGAIVVRTDPETYANEYYAVCIADKYETELKDKKNVPAAVYLADGTVREGLYEGTNKQDRSSEDIRIIREALTDTDYDEGFSDYVTALIHITSTDPIDVGSAAEVRITLASEKGVLAVPEAAVFTDAGDGSNYVWLYRSFGKKLVKTPVTVGLIANGTAAVKGEGLKAGSEVVCEFLTAGVKPEDKMKVRLAAEGETAEPTETAPEDLTDE